MKPTKNNAPIKATTIEVQASPGTALSKRGVLPEHVEAVATALCARLSECWRDPAEFDETFPEAVINLNGIEIDPNRPFWGMNEYKVPILPCYSERVSWDNEAQTWGEALKLLRKRKLLDFNQKDLLWIVVPNRPEPSNAFETPEKKPRLSHQARPSSLR
jgi:hypothetical protein